MAMHIGRVERAIGFGIDLRDYNGQELIFDEYTGILRFFKIEAHSFTVVECGCSLNVLFQEPLTSFLWIDTYLKNSSYTHGPLTVFGSIVKIIAAHDSGKSIRLPKVDDVVW